jgi:uncharacterized protein involved in exopolysaccharide biosynthesis
MKTELTRGFDRTNLSLREGSGVLFRRKAMIITAFLAIALATAAVTFLLPNKYESRMKILVKNMRVDVAITTERTTGGTGLATENEVGEAQINSEIELLTSKDLLEQVVKECGLAKPAPSLFSRAVPTEAVSIERAVNQLAKDLTITPVKKSNLISLSYASNSPEVSAAVLRKVGDLYLEKHLKLHRPPGTYEFFKTRAAEYEKQLRAAEARLSSFQQDKNLVVLSQQKDLTLQKTADAKSKMLEAEAMVSETANRIQRVQQQLAAVAPRIITQSRTLPNQYSAERLNTMIVELRNKRTQLLTKFRPEDRFVKEVDQQIRTTADALERATKQTATEQSTDLNPLRQILETELSRARLDHAGAEARRTALAGQLQQYQEGLKKLESATTEHDDLQRQTKEAEENYQLYAKKREESRIADEMDQQKITNVSIAEAPAVAHIPSTPNRPLNLIVGVLLAAFVGLGCAFSAELFSDSFHTPRQLEAMTGITVLATVPNDRRRLLTRKPKALPAANSRKVAEAG